MIRSAAHERILLSSSPGGDRPAHSHALRLPRAVRRWSWAAFALPAAMLLCAPLPAQVAAPQVRAEFRSPPRPLIAQAVDRSRMVATSGAVSGEVATAQDLGVRDPTSPMD